jgi:hypothetical protein
MKQKLIDSNNIEYHKVWIETSIEGQHDGCIMAYKNQIDGLPIVNAIPVEWIKDRLQKAVDFTHSKAEGKFIDNGCVVSVVSANFTANVLMSLLEDWENENG